MAGGPATDGTYSAKVGFLFVFNLIVGAGALALPQAFAKAGVISGTLLLLLLAFLSLMSVMYVVEALALGNAYRAVHKMSGAAAGASVNSASESASLLSPSESAPVYCIEERLELGRLADLFLGKMGVRAFYATMIIYLYGDLCIYAAAVPKSLRTAICGSNASDSDACMGSLTARQTYYVFLTVMLLVLGPFAFTNAQKTTALQVVTSLLRWMSFLMMIVIAAIGIHTRSGFDSTDIVPSAGDVETIDVSGLPTLFGVSIYAFMCQHSLPSLVTPIENKARLSLLFVGDFALVLAFYCILCFTAVFRFQESALDDLYSLNFKSYANSFCAYFLALFPVFTLSANFPIIAITLRNNLRTLCESYLGHDVQPFFGKVVLPLVTLLPPVAVAFGTDNVGLLVNVTGSYAGVGIQYVFPVLLCLAGRARCSSIPGENQFRSWFQHRYWAFALLLWSFACLVIVTFNHIYTKK